MKDPQTVIDSPEGEPDWGAWGDSVCKIVLGRLDTEGDKPALTLASLPADLAERFPKLTHLYVWKVAGLRTLPSLPAELECLDLRGCGDMQELPHLPSSLETLDVGDCRGLSRLPSGQAPARLEYLYVDGCSELRAHHLAGFLESLRGADAPLRELDASGTALPSLDEVPRTSLRKLRLRGCTKLASVSGLEDFPILEHLDLTDCTALGELPSLSPALRYLVLHGAESLTHFMGQDVGPYDRGEEEENVAAAFATRRKFGAELAVMPHAKLLLMGNGRVGKTTLAKRLQWEELSPEERRVREDLRPSLKEPSTHGIHFWHWRTGLRPSPSDRSALDRRATAASTELPTTKDGDLVGGLRLWDFGGQEIYHSTHRIFAGEGSIFLIVWCENPPPLDPPPEDVTAQEWREWNGDHSIDYWLDYVYSIAPHAKVALVCTQCADADERTQLPSWKTRKKSGTTIQSRYASKDLPCFHVDSLAANCAKQSGYQNLLGWIREASGDEARRIGILQPRVYRVVSDLIDGWLEENAAARRAERPANNLLVPWGRWEEQVRTAHAARRAGVQVELDAGDIAAITDYLHQAGHLFRAREGDDPTVIVDHSWAADLIYLLLKPGAPLRKAAKSAGGFFTLTELESDPIWKGLADDSQRRRLLAYMEQCRVITRIAGGERTRSGEDVFLASDKWLQPPYEDVEGGVGRKMELVRKRRDAVESEKFEFEELRLGELDFRALQAHLARTFRTDAVYFRTGLQVTEPGSQAPSWCFRLRWRPEDADPYWGAVDGVLVAPKAVAAGLSASLEALFFEHGSPLARFRRSDAEVRLRHGPSRMPEVDLGHEYFRKLRDEDYDIGVSSSGSDAEEVAALVAALKSAGYRPCWYREPECRHGENVRVETFIKTLGRQPAMILLLSDDYLRTNLDNWYCAWELADAVNRLRGSDRNMEQTSVKGTIRKVEQTIVLVKESEALRAVDFDERVAALLGWMQNQFEELYGAKRGADRVTFRYYDEFALHFSSAAQNPRCREFLNKRGMRGEFIPLPPAPNASGAWESLLAAVEKATGKKRSDA